VLVWSTELAAPLPMLHSVEQLRVTRRLTSAELERFDAG